MMEVTAACRLRLKMTRTTGALVPTVKGVLVSVMKLAAITAKV